MSPMPDRRRSPGGLTIVVALALGRLATAGPGCLPTVPECEAMPGLNCFCDHHPSDPACGSCARQLVADGQRALAPGTELTIPFDLPPAGGFDVTLDYTFDSSDLVVKVAPADCPLDSIRDSTCSAIAVAELRSRPLKLIEPQASPAPQPFASGGPLVLYIWNVGPNPESVAFQVVFGRGRCWF